MCYNRTTCKDGRSSHRKVVIAMSIMETYALLDMIFGIILEIVAIFVTVITIIVTRKK